MAILDVDGLLKPISDEEPCGPNLEYDVAYAEFELAARGKREQQYGETIIPSEEPNWREVQRLGSELITRSKDLRIACTFARGLLETEGLPAFADGLALIRGYVERYWPSLHPQLDPEDGNDPTLRVNTLSSLSTASSLSDQSTTIQSLRTVAMVSSPTAGRYSMRDLGIARGEIPPTPGIEVPKLAAIEAAFAECPLEQLRNNATAVRESLDHVETIESFVTQQVGVAQAVNMESLRDNLGELAAVLNSHLSRRDESMSEDVSVESMVTADGGKVSPGRRTGEIDSREDVVKALDKICEYYSRCEPSSPLPLLLGRAKRLARKSFLDIVKDLSPESVAQIKALGGVEQGETGE